MAAPRVVPNADAPVFVNDLARLSRHPDHAAQVIAFLDGSGFDRIIAATRGILMPGQELRAFNQLRDMVPMMAMLRIYYHATYDWMTSPDRGDSRLPTREECQAARDRLEIATTPLLMR